MEFKKVEYKGQKLEINFRNDIVFKQLLCSKDSLPFLEFLVCAVTKKRYKALKLARNEINGDHINDKTVYFDIYAKDENGRDVIIEMQNTIIGTIQSIRFQVYACKAIASKSIKGQDYSEVKTVDMIIITSERFRDELYSHGSFKFDDGTDFEGNLIHFHFISLPFIDELIQNKTHLSDIELLCYVFKNGIDSDIMKLANIKQKEMIRFMENSYQSTMNEFELFTLAEQQALKAWEERELAKEKQQNELIIDEQQQLIDQQNLILDMQKQQISKQNKQINDQSKQINDQSKQINDQSKQINDQNQVLNQQVQQIKDNEKIIAKKDEDILALSNRIKELEELLKQNN